MSTTEELLESFGDAFNRHDLDAIMSMMTEDCIWLTSAGEAPEGSRIEGQGAVREALAALLSTMPDARWSDPEYIIQGDRVCMKWRFTCTAADGTPVEKFGLDLLQLRDGKIWIKDTYRKQ